MEITGCVTVVTVVTVRNDTVTVTPNRHRGQGNCPTCVKWILGVCEMWVGSRRKQGSQRGTRRGKNPLSYGVASIDFVYTPKVCGRAERGFRPCNPEERRGPWNIISML